MVLSDFRNMKKYLLGFLLMAVFAFGQNKKVTATVIEWKGYKVLNTNALSHDGFVKLKAGNVVLNNGQIISGNFIMDMTSLTAEDMKNNPKMKLYLENHLKSDDFFDTEKYPTSFFKITSVKPSSVKGYNSLVMGSLTIKNTTKNISFPANIEINNGSVNFTSAKFSFNRKDFGLNYNVFEDMVIKNEVEMKVSFSAK